METSPDTLVTADPRRTALTAPPGMLHYQMDFKVPQFCSGPSAERGGCEVAYDKNAIFYCDEAGNTGPNYIDPQQPFYALGAFAVPADQVHEAAAQIELHRQRYWPQARELKAASILTRERGRRGAVSLIKALGMAGCVPLYIILEKRYCVAGKIVETFLDPPTNARVGTGLIGDTTTKQEIANTLYDALPQGVLNRFAAVYRSPTVAGFSVSLDEIVSVARAKVNPELAELIEGCRPSLAEIAELEVAASLVGNVEATLNLPALTSMLMMIELLGRLGMVSPVKLVHDETRAYQEGYRKTFGILRSAGEGSFAYPNGAMMLYPLRHVPELEFADSEQRVLLQAADILAGSLCYLAKRAMEHGSRTESEIELASLTLPALLCDCPTIAWSVGSDRWYRALGESFLTPLCRSEALPEGDGTASEHPTMRPPKMLPALSTRGVATEVQRYPLPFPVWGLIGRDSGELMSVAGLAEFGVPGGTAVLLFSSGDAATTFLEYWRRDCDLTEEQEVREFGPKELGLLVELLVSASRGTQTLGLDPGSDGCVYFQLANVIAGLNGILDRVRRAVCSGIFDTLYQEHDVEGTAVVSYLSSDGSYLAMRRPNGLVCRGRTREEAANEAARAERVS